MKIQSISDLITNSSNEAFMIVSKDTRASLKNAVAKLLEAFNVKKSIDEVIKIRPDIDYKNDYDITAQVIDLLLTGRFCYDYSEDDNGEYQPWSDDEDDFTEIDGYPKCKSKDEITIDMMDDALLDINEVISCDKDHWQRVNNFKIEAIKPEYENIAIAINAILSSLEYEVFYG